MSEETFEIGDRVSWKSQSGGVYTEKVGRIVRVLERRTGHSTTPTRVARKEFPNHKTMFDGLGLPGNADRAYLIEVVRSKRAKKRLYMPYPKNLRLLERPTEEQKV